MLQGGTGPFAARVATADQQLSASKVAQGGSTVKDSHASGGRCDVQNRPTSDPSEQGSAKNMSEVQGDRTQCTGPSADHHMKVLLVTSLTLIAVS